MTFTCRRSQAHPGQGVPFRQPQASGVRARTGTDHLYSVAALTNASGAVVERYGYDAYGKQIVMDAAGTVKAGRTQNYGFTGREWDSETGLWYFRARMYSDRLGRFVSRDPAGYVDGYALYNGYFVPGGTDPWGLALEPEITRNQQRVIPENQWREHLRDFWGVENYTALGISGTSLSISVTGETVSSKPCECKFTLTSANITTWESISGAYENNPSINNMVSYHEEYHANLFILIGRKFIRGLTETKSCSYGTVQQTESSCSTKAEILKARIEAAYTDYANDSGDAFHWELRRADAVGANSYSPFSGNLSDLIEQYEEEYNDQAEWETDDWDCTGRISPEESTGGGSTAGGSAGGVSL